VVLLNLVFASSLCRVSRLGEVFFKPLLAATLATGGSWVIYICLLLPHAGEGALATGAAILLTVVLYLFFALLTGAISAELIILLPMGERLCRILQKMRLLETPGALQRKGTFK